MSSAVRALTEFGSFSASEGARENIAFTSTSFSNSKRPVLAVGQEARMGSLPDRSSRPGRAAVASPLRVNTSPLTIVAM